MDMCKSMGLMGGGGENLAMGHSEEDVMMEGEWS